LKAGQAWLLLSTQLTQLISDGSTVSFSNDYQSMQDQYLSDCSTSWILQVSCCQFVGIMVQFCLCWVVEFLKNSTMCTLGRHLERIEYSTADDIMLLKYKFLNIERWRPYVHGQVSSWSVRRLDSSSRVCWLLVVAVDQCDLLVVSYWVRSRSV